MKAYLNIILLTSLITITQMISSSVYQFEEKYCIEQKQHQKTVKKEQHQKQEQDIPKSQNKQKQVIKSQDIPKTQHPEESQNSIFTNTQLQQMRHQFLKLMNHTRVSPLSLSDSLITSATLRAKEASQKWSHTRPDGTRWNTTLHQIIDIQTVPHGENLAQTEISSTLPLSENEIHHIITTLHQRLVNSPTHYQVMTNPNYKKVNIGIYAQQLDQKIIITIAQHYIDESPS